MNPQSEIRNPKSASLGIKWPNDVMLDGGKVCGILIESPGGAAPPRTGSSSASASTSTIVGVRPRSAAGPNGIALCDVTSSKHELQAVLTNTLNAIQQRIDQLAKNDPQLPTAWQQLVLANRLNVEVHANGSGISGICLGIDGDGALLVEDVFKTHRVHSGTVRVRQ